ncbi:MAG: hypothetical protein LW832_09605 [Parachlamydia sp.]|jgi:hypothetical protein|nr:hypothetical protein [Parachlamydia sp.]
MVLDQVLTELVLTVINGGDVLDDLAEQPVFCQFSYFVWAPDMDLEMVVLLTNSLEP